VSLDALNDHFKIIYSCKFLAQVMVSFLFSPLGQHVAMMADLKLPLPSVKASLDQSIRCLGFSVAFVYIQRN